MWKNIKISPYYSVNEYGEIKRNSYTRVDTMGRITVIKEKKLSQHLDKDGYWRVMIVTGLKKAKNIPVHKLVAETFIPNPNNLPCINHKNENKQDNRVENLEWCSVSYNNSYGKRLQSMRNTEIKKYGKKIVAIKDKDIYYFNSISQASEKLNLNRSNISNCLAKRLKRTGGYEFIEFVERKEVV